MMMIIILRLHALNAVPKNYVTTSYCLMCIQFMSLMDKIVFGSTALKPLLSDSSLDWEALKYSRSCRVLTLNRNRYPLIEVTPVERYMYIYLKINGVECFKAALARGSFENVCESDAWRFISVCYIGNLSQSTQVEKNNMQHTQKQTNKKIPTNSVNAALPLEFGN